MTKVAKKEFIQPTDYKGKIYKVKLRAADHWSGVQKFDDCRTILYPLMDGFGRTVTGLSLEDESRLETELGLEKGHLARNSKFWTTFFIQLDSKGITLDTSDPQQELQYLFLLRSKKISKSLKAITPDALGVMYCEEDEAKTANVTRGVKVKAFKKFSTLTHDDMKKILTMYGKRAVDSMANDVIEDILGAEVELNPKRFLDIADDPNLEKKMFITGLINKGILKKIGNRIVYGETTLGADLDSAVQFLSDSKNQPILLTLKELK